MDCLKKLFPDRVTKEEEDEDDNNKNDDNNNNSRESELVDENKQDSVANEDADSTDIKVHNNQAVFDNEVSEDEG